MTTPSFTVARDALIAELVHADRVIERKTALPVLAYVLIQATHGRLVVRATDLDVSFEAEMDATVSGEGAVALPATKLRQLIAAMSGDVRWEGLPHASVCLSSDALEIKVAGFDGDDFPHTPTLSPSRPCLELPAAPVLRAIQATRYAVAESGAGGPQFARAARLTVQNAALEMVATDGRRLAHYREPIDSAVSVEACLTGKALHELERLLGGRETCSVQDQDNHVLVTAGTRTLAQKKVEAEYPDVAPVVAIRHPRQAVVAKAALVAAVKRALLFASKQIVRMRAAGSVLIVEAHCGEGSARDELAIDSSGGPWAIGFNGRYLLDLLGAIEGDVCIQVSRADQHGVFLPMKKARGESVHILAPVRLDDAELHPTPADAEPMTAGTRA